VRPVQNRGSEIAVRVGIVERGRAYILIRGCRAGCPVAERPAAAAPARAEIVYKQMYDYIVNQGTYLYDFNGNGVVDLTFRLSLRNINCGYVITGAEAPGQGNGAEGDPPAPLQVGDEIGPGQQFFARRQAMGRLKATYCNGWKVAYLGSWPQNEVRYLGVRFLIDGKAHYAWASVEFTVITGFGPPKLVAILTGYAYETIPGKPIAAGHTR